MDKLSYDAFKQHFPKATLSANSYKNLSNEWTLHRTPEDKKLLDILVQRQTAVNVMSHQLIKVPFWHCTLQNIRYLVCIPRVALKLNIDINSANDKLLLSIRASIKENWGIILIRPITENMGEILSPVMHF